MFAVGGGGEAEILPGTAGKEPGVRLDLSHGLGEARRQAAALGGSPAKPLLDGCMEHLDLLVQLLCVGAESEASPGAPFGGAAGAAIEALARSSAELTGALCGSPPLARPPGQPQRWRHCRPFHVAPSTAGGADADGQTSRLARPMAPGDAVMDPGELRAEPDGATTASVAHDSAQGAQEDAAAQAEAGRPNRLAKSVSFGGDKQSGAVIDPDGLSAEPDSPEQTRRLQRLTRSVSSVSRRSELSLGQFERQCTTARTSRTMMELHVTEVSSEHIQVTGMLRRCCQKVIASVFFEWLVAAVIFANSVFTGLQADWGIHHPGQELPWGYRFLDNALVLFFTLELILRIVAEGCAFFSPQNPEFRWNVFDSALVATSYWELLTVSLGVLFIKTNVTRLLRLSRLMRAMRVLRTWVVSPLPSR